jgi:hypothetical protein
VSGLKDYHLSRHGCPVLCVSGNLGEQDCIPDLSLSTDLAEPAQSHSAGAETLLSAGSLCDIHRRGLEYTR